MIQTEYLLLLAGLLFALGALGFLLRRNLIIVLASVELMLNAANLTFLAGSRLHGGPEGLNMDGPIFFLFVILVAACEAAVGLALVIAFYRQKQTVDLEAATELKG